MQPVMKRNYIGEDMNTTNLFDLLITFSGVYLVYAAIVMKKDGRILSGIMNGKESDADKMRDKDGFIGYMFGRLMGLGILVVISGVGSIINTKAGGPVYISLIGVIVVLIVLVLFAVSLRKARKKFVE